MASSKQMLDTYPRSFNVDAEVLAGTIDVIVECANTCNQCADACLAEDNVEPMVKCVRLNLDCADACNAAARILGRQTEYDANIARTQLEACAAACKSCGDECDQHAGKMEHCKLCAEVCRRCEQACRDLLGAIS